jgi:hypothetical protein
MHDWWAGFPAAGAECVLKLLWSLLMAITPHFCINLHMKIVCSLQDIGMAYDCSWGLTWKEQKKSIKKDQK